jgi:hypothetical protein
MSYLNGISLPPPTFQKDMQDRFVAGEPVQEYLQRLCPEGGTGRYTVQLLTEDLPSPLYVWRFPLGTKGKKPLWAYYLEIPDWKPPPRRRRR